MIEFNAEANTCRVSGTLDQQDVVSLWPDRHKLLSPQIDRLDLSALSYSDSAGIAFLLALWRLHRQSGHTLTLTAPSEQVARLIALYDLQACFE
ncbi:STAS domain-containing protein [Shewanella corallii]|uniref:STAS domain-containing protein n=2 Tax=Shewanella TaxID=22 RepID=A0ABT0N7S8_9GAMM|nr:MULTISPECIES: STAS domain-containing protein [Shewanella]MCL1038594.1 STAS domain-containing protein [Shewanella submarina]MCL2914432.1 STAS domain-containing protein [Shewanella corallii]